MKLKIVNNLINKVLPPYVNFPATRYHITGNPTASYSVKPVGPCNSSNCLVLILQRKLGNYLLYAGESCGPTAQHIHKPLYQSMFDTKKEVDYSLRPRRVCCTESWCPSVILDTMETPATKAIAPSRVPRDTCVIALPKNISS